MTDRFDKAAEAKVRATWVRFPSNGTYIVQLLATALREQHEKACAVTCFRCANRADFEPAQHVGGSWKHAPTKGHRYVGHLVCGATAIRRAFAEGG